jgi:hypothetical protein
MLQVLGSTNVHSLLVLRLQLIQKQSLQPREPTPQHEARNPFDAWNREVTSTFSAASRLSDDADLESQRVQGEDLLQALSLPQLRSFLNSRI